MRIVVFAWMYEPFLGGAEIALKHTLEQLDEHEFTIITARMQKDLPVREEHGHITIERVGSGSKLDKYTYVLRASRKAQQLHAQEPFDASHCLMINAATPPARRFTKKTRVPALLTLQSGDTEGYLKRHMGPYALRYKQLYRYADHIHAISNYLKQRAVKNGVHAQDVTVVPNGVDTKTFSKHVPKKRRDELREELGLTEEPVVITTSRLVPKNGVDTLIKAMAHLPDWHLLILGDGHKKDTYKKHAENTAHDRIHLLGNKPYDQLPDYLALADVFCRPSRSEGFGNSFIEALCAGVPIVGTRVGGIPDFLEDGKNGKYCEQDPASVAQAIQEARSITPAFDKKRYDWKQIAAEINSLYKKLGQE